MTVFFRTIFLLLCLLLAGCSAQPHEPSQAESWPEPNNHCSSAGVLLDAHFEAGNLGQCDAGENRRFTLTLIPENRPPINTSPWFAFRASGEPGDRAVIRLEFVHGYARYWPKTSPDGVHWTPMPRDQVSVGPEKKWMEIRLNLENHRLWVAGQEIVDYSFYGHWLDALEASGEVELRLLGPSVEGRPIYLAQTHDRPEFVLFIGRQHPPEVTGALGMRAFIDTVFSDSELARRFRARFKLGIVPLLNPDGVAAGHWRHNVNGVDVNRDWGPFTQPETQAVMGWVEQQEAAGRLLSLVLDFHSTREDLFYTQPVSDDPPDFASSWLAASARRLPDFSFKHDAGPVSEQPNAKNYFYTSRGIPAITYEAGDETDRESIRGAAVVFAEEMMRTLLATPEP